MASEAIQREALESIRWISLAAFMVALFRFGFLFPMFLSAQLTAFLTKFRSSVAPRLITGNNLMNFSSSASLSCHARQAISAKAVLLTNSSSRSDQSRIFFQAKAFFSKRFAHTWSQTSQELMSFTQSSICFSVNFSGSSIIAARILASGFHNSSASLWSLPNSFAIFALAEWFNGILSKP